MQEQYITHLDTQARIELEKEKARLIFRAIAIGEIVAAAVAVIYIISKI